MPGESTENFRPPMRIRLPDSSTNRPTVRLLTRIISRYHRYLRRRIAPSPSARSFPIYRFVVRIICIFRDCSTVTGADLSLTRQESGEATWEPVNDSECATNSANGSISSLIVWTDLQPPGNVATVSEKGINLCARGSLRSSLVTPRKTNPLSPFERPIDKTAERSHS